MRKWVKGQPDVTTATNEELEEYANTKTFGYDRGGFMDGDLWEMFQSHFGEWSRETWNMTSIDNQSNLRKLLLSRGVFIPSRGPRKAIRDTLVHLATEEDQHVWTDEEIVESL